MQNVTRVTVTEAGRVEVTLVPRSYDSPQRELNKATRAYVDIHRVDLVATPGNECHELWLGDAFKGEIRRTSGGYAVRFAGERFEEPYRKLAHVIEDLGLDPRDARILGL